MPPPLRLPTLAILWAGFGLILAAAPTPPVSPTPAAAVAAPPGTEAAESADEADPHPASPKADAAAARFWAAVHLLRSDKPAEQKAGVAALRAAADLEDPQAQILLANCYMSGDYGFPKDQRKAVNFFRLAAERGNGFAMVALGTAYASGIGTGASDAQAARWLTAALASTTDFSRPAPPPEEIAAEAQAAGPGGVAGSLVTDPVSQSQATAHYILGMLETKQKKPAAAQAHFVAAATGGPNGNSGIFQAAVLAAVNYAFGSGIPRDLARANAMIEQSRKLTARMGVTMIQNSIALKFTDEFAGAELEDALNEASADYSGSMQLAIAQSLADKKSKAYDSMEAAKWYELAAESGQVWAMMPLALIYCRGEAGSPDPAKAFHWFEKAGGGDSPKHLLAVGNLGICYQNGIGTAKDPVRAAALFKKYRDTDIVCYLGHIGQCPPRPLNIEEGLELNETWAKKKKDPEAQYLLGMRYVYGWAVDANPASANRWFKKAAEANHPLALWRLGLNAQSTADEYRQAGSRSSADRALKEALDYFRRASDAGSSDGATSLAIMYHNGLGVPQDVARAEALYLKSIKLDPESSATHRDLGLVYEERLEQALKQNDANAATAARTAMLEHFERARAIGSADASVNLGVAYFNGKLVPQDYRKAYAYYEEAALLGSTEAHYNMGIMHEQGISVPVTYTEAAYHFRLAALDGDLDALRHLVNLYLTGQGVSLDLDRAAFWLTQMVNRGNSRVLTTYCDVMLRKKSYDNALTLLREMADATDTFISGYACDRLAYCYTQGLGVTVNLAKAKRYNARAIKLGSTTALAQLGADQIEAGKVAEGLANLERAASESRQANYALGIMHYFGTHVPKDEAKGIRYIEVAAEGNHTDAMFFLAALTYHHKPGAPTLDAAIQFAQRAETNGNAKAGALREELEQRRRKN